MNRDDAEAEIKQLFANYRAALPEDTALLESLSNGKLYELFVLCHVVEELTNRGFTLRFTGGSIKFKGAPGMIKDGDPHFKIYAPNSRGNPDLWLYVDIEFDTLGHSLGNVADDSRRHEIDIVVVSSVSHYPQFYEIALGVECKAWAKFKKKLIKEALGIRRELGFLCQHPSPSVLSRFHGITTERVPMYPPSEYWLAFTDPKGADYQQSPAIYGITLKHLAP